MFRVYTSAGPEDAHLVCDLLIHNGIKAVVQGDTLWAARGDIPVGPGTAPSVWVNEPDVERARVLIEEYETRPKQHPPSWTCPVCDEEIGGQFSECWKCGRRRDASTV